LEGAIEEFEGEIPGVSLFFEDAQVIVAGEGAATGKRAMRVVLLAGGEGGIGVVDVDVGEAIEGKGTEIVEGGAAVPEVKKVQNERAA
jgi:hypothetical protein